MSTYKHESAAVRATPEWAAYQRATTRCVPQVDGQARVTAEYTKEQKAVLEAAWNVVKATNAWAAAAGD